MAVLHPDRLGKRILRDLGEPGSRVLRATEAGCWYAAGNERLDQGEPKRTVTVDQSYIGPHTPIIREQLVKAGIRLAALLDRALGD
jgi:hypothetical protein